MIDPRCRHGSQRILEHHGHIANGTIEPSRSLLWPFTTTGGASHIHNSALQRLGEMYRSLIEPTMITPPQCTAILLLPLPCRYMHRIVQGFLVSVHKDERSLRSTYVGFIKTWTESDIGLSLQTIDRGRLGSFANPGSCQKICGTTRSSLVSVGEDETSCALH